MLAKISLCAGFVALLMGSTAHAEYLAYAVGKKSKVPLPESIDTVDAKYLINLEWGTYEGARTRVAVLNVDNTSSSSSVSITGADGQSITQNVDQENVVPVNGIEAIITDVMNRTGRFRLLERQALSAVLSEQDLVTSERVTKPSGAKTGNVLGARYLVQVAVTDYEANVSGREGGGVGLLRNTAAFGGLGMKSSRGRVGLNVRLIDAETSEVVYTKQIESVIKESGLTVVGFGGSAGFNDYLGGFLSNYSKTPIGQAVIAGINKGIYELAKQIGAEPAAGSIIQVKGGQIWINLGRGSVSVGEELRVWEKGEALIDPDTGISLGSMDTDIGGIRVMQVQERFSIAAEVSMTGQASRGHKVVSTKRPPSIEFAARWEKPKRGKF